MLQSRKFGKIHDVVKLLDSCAVYDSDFKQYREKIAKFTFYYIQARYPDIGEIDKFSKEEAETAYETAKEVVEFAAEKFKY